MYGKVFERMYTGSMMGSGAMMFAVWPFVIAHMKPNRERTVFTVELNTQLMALLIGEKESEIEKIIQQCCEPDPKSRTPDNEGRKLVKLGNYLYEVVNGAAYDQIKRAEELRESNRRRQEKHYWNKKGEQPPESSKPNTNGRPTADECIQMAIEMGMDREDGESFHDHYCSNGWKVGKNSMKDVKATMRGWKRRAKTYSNGSSEGKNESVKIAPKNYKKILDDSQQ